jgi:hypothetical protein
VWRTHLSASLKHRNQEQTDVFCWYTQCYNEIVASERKLRAQNGAYELEVSALRAENTALHSNLKMAGGHRVSAVETGELQQKLADMSAQLVDAYRDRAIAAETKLRLHHATDALERARIDVARLESLAEQQANTISGGKNSFDELNASRAAMAAENRELQQKLADMSAHARSMELRLMEHKQKSVHKS